MKADRGMYMPNRMVCLMFMFAWRRLMAPNAATRRSSRPNACTTRSPEMVSWLRVFSWEVTTWMRCWSRWLTRPMK